MISKIVMSGTASYMAPTTLETDKTVNLVYGLNATGKTTLSNFLQDPDDSDFVGCTLEESGSSQVLVYNQRFIGATFWESSTIPGIFSLSSENKEISERIEAIRGELNSVDASITDLQGQISSVQANRQSQERQAANTIWAIKSNYSGGDRVLEFCLEGLKGSKERLFEHINTVPKPDAPPTRTIDDIKKDAEPVVADSTEPINTLSEVTFPAQSLENDSLFGRRVVGAGDTAVAELIDQLENADWVRQGLSYLPKAPSPDGSPCPFCQQVTITPTLTKMLQDYFDEYYQEDVKRITKAAASYRNAVEEIDALKELEQNPFIRHRLSEFQSLHRKVTNILEENLRSIDNKLNAPSQTVTLSSSLEAVEELNQLLSSVNSEIQAYNTRLADRKTALDNLKHEFWAILRWEYDQTLARYHSDVEQSNAMIEALQTQLSEKQEQKRQLEAKIADLQASTVNIDAAINNINRRLVDLGLDAFRIEKCDDRNYRIARAGDAASEFQSLSEGEKMIISFLYFCESSKGRQDATDVGGSKTIVIDDPISSLSHIFVFNIAQLIRREFFNSSEVDQVFVLMHSLYFFYELTERRQDRRHEYQKLFRITKSPQGSKITNLKYHEIQNDYHAYWSIVNNRENNPALIANAMRNILEHFFGFVRKSPIDNIFSLSQLQDPKYRAFQRFMNRESHSVGENLIDYKEFDYDLFYEALRLLFEELDYKEHYQAMSKIGKQ